MPVNPSAAASWVQKTPDVCGGDAASATPGTASGAWSSGGSSAFRTRKILEHHPDLTPADLEAAWAYYAANREEINRAIQENEEA